MYKRFIILIICFSVLFLSLKINKSSENSFFAPFDNVIHFELDLPDSLEKELDINATSGTAAYFYGNLPNTLSPSVKKDLSESEYTINTINKEKHRALDSIFSYKPYNQVRIVNLCTPEYRDLLIFEYKRQIIGVAQICFSCNKYRFIGAKAVTDNFGQHKEYSKLKAILKK